jgi:3-hydroxyacyl-[acyl-carrier-protein] dehydratase
MTHLPLAIDPQHPAFEGHFPSRPIVPGVVLLDCGLRAIAAHRGAAHGDVRIGAAKFLSMVGPGEPVRLEIDESSTASTPDGYRLRIFAGRPDDERLAVSGTISFDAVAPDPGL